MILTPQQLKIVNKMSKLTAGDIKTALRNVENTFIIDLVNPTFLGFSEDSFNKYSKITAIYNIDNWVERDNKYSSTMKIFISYNQNTLTYTASY